MNASRMKAETHWRNVGRGVAARGGSLADLDRVLTGKPTIDGWISEGFATANRRISRKLAREAASAN